MKTISFIVILLLFWTVVTYGQDNTLFNLNLHSTTVEVTNTKTGKVRINNDLDSYFFFTRNSIFDADDYGFFELMFISKPIFKSTYFKGDKFFQSVVIDAINTTTNEVCKIMINKHISDSTYIMTIRYDLYLLKYNCKEF